VRAAWQRAEADGALPALPDGADAPPVELTRPQNQEHGDLATNLAMKLARPLRRPPMQIAAALVDALRAGWSMGESGPVLSADVAPPGFINLRLAPRTPWTASGAPARTSVGSSSRTHRASTSSSSLQIPPAP
jgi:arginyl-tRNA synthetase